MNSFLFCIQLTDTRTHDKRLTLLHFIVETIEERFPDIGRFDTDLQAVEKAAQGNKQTLSLQEMSSEIFFPDQLQEIYIEYFSV